MLKFLSLVCLCVSGYFLVGALTSSQYLLPDTLHDTASIVQYILGGVSLATLVLVAYFTVSIDRECQLLNAIEDNEYLSGKGAWDVFRSTPYDKLIGSLSSDRKAILTLSVICLLIFVFMTVLKLNASVKEILFSITAILGFWVSFGLLSKYVISWLWYFDVLERIPQSLNKYIRFTIINGLRHINAYAYDPRFSIHKQYLNDVKIEDFCQSMLNKSDGPNRHRYIFNSKDINSIGDLTSLGNTVQFIESAEPLDDRTLDMLCSYYFKNTSLPDSRLIYTNTISFQNMIREYLDKRTEEINARNLQEKENKDIVKSFNVEFKSLKNDLGEPYFYTLLSKMVYSRLNYLLDELNAFNDREATYTLLFKTPYRDTMEQMLANEPIVFNGNKFILGNPNFDLARTIDIAMKMLVTALNSEILSARAINDSVEVMYCDDEGEPLVVLVVSEGAGNRTSIGFGNKCPIMEKVLSVIDTALDVDNVLKFFTKDVKPTFDDIDSMFFKRYVSLLNYQVSDLMKLNSSEDIDFDCRWNKEDGVTIYCLVNGFCVLWTKGADEIHAGIHYLLPSSIDYKRYADVLMTLLEDRVMTINPALVAERKRVLNRLTCHD